MRLNVEDPDGDVGIRCVATENNSGSLGRPVGVQLLLEVFLYHLAWRSPIDRNGMQLRLLAGRIVKEDDLLAIGRPARLHGIESRRVAELESQATIQLAGPECSLGKRDIGHPLPIFIE